MRVEADDPAYRPVFVIKGFRGFPMPAAPAPVWALGVGASLVLIPTLTGVFAGWSTRLAPGPVGVLFGAAFAVLIGIPAVVAVCAVIARLHTPETPFPSYYLRAAVSAVRAPKPQPARTVQVSVPGPLFPARRVTVSRRLHESRSPHVCCPHHEPAGTDRPSTDPEPG